MSFSSRRRNYLLTPHRRDGFIEWMKSMLQHSFVLDALETTGGDTFSHFELLIDEHRKLQSNHGDSPTTANVFDHHHGRHHAIHEQPQQQSRLRQLVPTIGTFHTHLPLREAFEIYNAKHKLTKRKHIQISFNEIRHILNYAQIMAMRTPEKSSSNNENDNVSNGGNETKNTNAKENRKEEKKEQQTMNGPKMMTFDGDQTLYTDGANFESNPRLATYLYQLLKHGVIVAVVTAAGYEYNVEKYEYRLSGLLAFFKEKSLTGEECERFYLFGGECNYLLRMGSDYHLHAVKENGPGGWLTSTKYMKDSPANWDPNQITSLLDTAEGSIKDTVQQLNIRGMVIRKKRAIGLIPKANAIIPREVLDEAVLHVQETIDSYSRGIISNNRHDGNTSAGSKRDIRGSPVVNNNNTAFVTNSNPLSTHGTAPKTSSFGSLPYCAFNGGKDCWFDVGNKRVGVQILQSYLGIPKVRTLHIGDQFLNTGNDFAARDVCPCIWITSPEETTYILKSILRLAGLPAAVFSSSSNTDGKAVVEDDEGSQISSSPPLGPKTEGNNNGMEEDRLSLDFSEVHRRNKSTKRMNVYTGEIVGCEK